MNPGSRGAVEGGGCTRVVVDEGRTQLMRSMLSAKVEPVGQSWACGAGGGGAEAGALIGTFIFGDSLMGLSEMRH